MDEYDIMIPEGYEEKFKKVWKNYDSWKNLHEVDVDDLDDKEKKDDEDDW